MRGINYVFSGLFLLFLVTTAPQVMASQKRIALVTGNSEYQHIGTLANPKNDARLMAHTLRRLGYQVIEKYDLGQKGMKRATRRFNRKLARAGQQAIGFLYYAGHGVRVKGVNYLIPVDAEIADESNVEIEALAANAILAGMRNLHNRLNVIVLDACRDNPFSGFRSTARGLARMDAPVGSLLAFSTQPGNAAVDGTRGRNSSYTAALATRLKTPGLKLEEVFKRVRVEVRQATQGQQIPWESTSLFEDYYPAGKARHTQ